LLQRGLDAFYNVFCIAQSRDAVELMKAVVAILTEEDILAVGACLAALIHDRWHRR
jgi:hypothetical protein